MAGRTGPNKDNLKAPQVQQRPLPGSPLSRPGMLRWPSPITPETGTGY